MAVKNPFRTTETVTRERPARVSNPFHAQQTNGQAIRNPFRGVEEVQRPPSPERLTERISPSVKTRAALVKDSFRQDVERLKQDPLSSLIPFRSLITFKDTALSGLSLVGLPFERLEASVANPLRQLQKGKISPTRLARAAGRGIIGAEAGEFGDLFSEAAESLGAGERAQEVIGGVGGLATFGALTMGPGAVGRISQARKLALSQKLAAQVRATSPAVKKTSAQLLSKVAGQTKSLDKLQRLDVIQNAKGQTFRVASITRKKGGPKLLLLENLKTGRKQLVPQAELKKRFKALTLNRQAAKDIAEEAILDEALTPKKPSKLVQKLPPAKDLEIPAKQLTVGDRLARLAQPVVVVERAISAQGPTGRRFAEMLRTVRSRFERRTGQHVEAYLKASRGLDQAGKTELIAALNEGKRVTNPQVRDVFKLANAARQEIARDATQIGFVARLRSGQEVPFIPRKNFYPHITPRVDASPEIIDAAINNAVRIGAFKTRGEAAKFWTDYTQWVKTGKRSERIVEWMVKKGRARNRADAQFILQRFINRNRVQRSSNLERARELDFPLWDPDPTRVLPDYYLQAFRRIEQAKAFGLRNEKAKDMIDLIGIEGGDAFFVREAFNRIVKPPVNQTAFFGKMTPELQRGLKSLQVWTKMGFSGILNAPQGFLDSYIKTGLIPAIKGLRRASTAEGRDFALRSGATLEAVATEISREMGRAPSAQKFLRAVGFNATEIFNRVLSANAAREYFPRLLKRLQRNPRDGIARREFQRVGINPETVLKRGRIAEEELLEAANRFVNITQFRAGVQDLPLFASSATGRMMFQFKSFVTGFTRFMTDSVLNEARKGNLRPATRWFVAGGLTGEAVRDVIDTLRGNPRPGNPAVRLLENLATVGGIGVYGEIFQAAMFGKASGIFSMMLGPTVDETVDLSVNTIMAATGKPMPLIRQLMRATPVVGPTLRNLFLPSERLKQERGTTEGITEFEGFEGFEGF